MERSLQALCDAVEAAGGQSALARKTGRSQPTIWYWVNKLGRVPAEDVIVVEQATGVARQRLRPDLYQGTPSTTPAPAAPANSSLTAAESSVTRSKVNGGGA